MTLNPREKKSDTVLYKGEKETSLFDRDVIFDVKRCSFKSERLDLFEHMEGDDLLDDLNDLLNQPKSRRYSLNTNEDCQGVIVQTAI